MNIPTRRLVFLAFLLVIVAFAAHRVYRAAKVAETAVPQPQFVPAAPEVMTVTDKATPATSSPTVSAVRPSSPDLLRSVLEELDPAKRRAALAEFGARMAERDPEKAWSVLSSVRGLADRQAFASAVVQVWARSNPRQALQAATALPPGELQAQCAAVAAGEWATNSPAEAMQFAVSSLEGSARQMAVYRVASKWARRDPAAAANWASSNSQSASGLGAITEVMELWGDTDPETGVSWASSLPKGPFKTQAMQSVLSTWADQFPEEAAAWATRAGQLDGTAAVVAFAWAKSDPEAAMAWVSSLPPGPAREDALPQVLASWSAAAPRRALEWVERQGGTKRKELTVGVLTTWSTTDPAAAYEWARTRPDAGALIEPILQSWSAQDPQAFLQWANAVPSSSRSDEMLGLMAMAASDASPAKAMDYANAMTNASMRADFAEQVLSGWEQVDKAAADEFRRRSSGFPR